MHSKSRVEGYPMVVYRGLIMHSEPRLKGLTKYGGVWGPNNAFAA